MRSALVIIIIACLGLLHACERTETDTPERTLKITLHHCANPVFSGTQVSLCFDSVLTDSRCPANAMCVWRGYAACKFSFTADGETYPFNLSEFAMLPVYRKDTVLAGYRIEFLDLQPYPGTLPYPVPENKIKAEVKITKL